MPREELLLSPLARRLLLVDSSAHVSIRSGVETREGAVIEPAADIARGMEVYASDGEKVGAVNHLWPQATDVVTGVVTEGYFSVHTGGVLGLGGTDLYVPFAAVEECLPGERVTLRVTKGEARTQFAHKPDFLTLEA